MTQHADESIKYRNIQIQNELKKCSSKVLKEFQNLFPCKKLYTLEIMRVDESNLTFDVEYFSIETPNKFWIDWHRFKQIKVFL